MSAQATAELEVHPPRRQIQSGAALRSVPGAQKVSAVLTQIHPNALGELKNAYSLEFLSLPDDVIDAGRIATGS